MHVPYLTATVTLPNPWSMNTLLFYMLMPMIMLPE